MKLLLRLLASAIATGVAVWLVPGLRIVANTQQQYAVTLVFVATILGVVNGIVRPLATTLSLCLVVFTFGLFLLVINAAMLTLAAYIGQQFGLQFYVDDFLSALLGSSIISLVGSVVAGVLGAQRG